MNANNLFFFDRNGENINLQYEDNMWKGTIYFDPLSIFLFDNENIFMLEKIGNDYKFPGLLPGQSLEFSWEDAETNKDVFFLYDVVKDFELKNYFIDRKEFTMVTYDDILPTSDGSQIDIRYPLQLNVAFNPSSETEFNRTLKIFLIDGSSPERQQIAEIKLYGEGIDEDERFRIWTQNFGIKFNKEDANILKDYDIKEAFPDWEKLNETRKSLLVNKEHIYPYIGTYKGLSNFINMLGYKDVLQVKEYWKNMNTSSTYFDKLFMVDISDFLDDGKIDNLNILDKNKNIKFGKQFKKTEFLALVYQFTVATDEFDDDGIPVVESTTEFTANEIFYKLNALKAKLKEEFLPINVKIKDIIGEYIYFQKMTVKWWKDDIAIRSDDLNEKSDIGCFPGEDDRLTLRSLDPLYRQAYPNGIDFGVGRINNDATNPFEYGQRYTKEQIPGITNYINEYYKEIKEQRFPDLSSRLTWEFGDDPERIIGAPIILSMDLDKFTVEDLRGVKLEDIDDPYASIRYWTLDNIDFRNIYEVTWRITKPAPNPYNFSYRGKASDLQQLPHFLPFAGEYTVATIIHDFGGNCSIYSKKVIVDDCKTPEIIGFTRLEDKFDYTISNLDNVRLIDFGASQMYYPQVNVLDNENTANRFDIFKNVMEWEGFFKTRYGLGQNLYDVEIYDENAKAYIPYSDPTQDHPKLDYWGLGKDTSPMKLSDYKGVEVREMYFQRIADLIYQGDFLAGFYIEDPSPSDTIKISLFSEYVLPDFNSLQELADILNDENHPGIRLFNYEIINGKIHAQAEYFSKEMYHILEAADKGSLLSPRIADGTDKYTFFLPKDVYSERMIEYLKATFPAFDVETLFLLAKTSDILTGAVQDPYFWKDEKYWKYENDEQIGHLPSVMDENAFSISKVKLYNERFVIPENAPVFFVINNIDGKNEFIWTLTDEITGEEIMRVRSVPFFVWKFKDSGKFTLTVEVEDNRKTTYSNSMKNMITVKDKRDYIEHVEKRLDTRKVLLTK